MGQSYTVRVVDGLLEIELSHIQDQHEILTMMRDVVRRWTTSEFLSTDECLKVNRATRLCYELHLSSKMTHMDALDIEVLYALKEDRVLWLHKVLNAYRGRLRITSPDAILVGDRVAKGMASVLDD